MIHSLLSIELFLRAFLAVVPLEVFVFVGSFLEELISPIPSTLIMGTAGSIANASGQSVAFLLLLSGIGNVGKLIGAFLYYVLGDKLEDVVIKKFGRFFGVTHEQVEGLGKKFSGHWKDGFVLFALRVVPFVPTTPVSIACGIVRMPLRTFVWASFLGNFIKDFFYLLIGYMGIAVFREFAKEVVAIRQYVDIAIGAGIVVFFFLLWYHRKKGVWLWQWCRGRCGNFFGKHTI